MTGYTVNLKPLLTEVLKKFHQINKNFFEHILSFDQNDIRVLNNIEGISRDLAELESIMSTQILNSMLSEYTTASNEISRSIHNLRLKGHGALIVVEKTDPVAPLLSGGTFIRGKTSSQLLESIFNPSSPFHNGAVLIQSDKITSASNELPITEQVFWDRMFNARELSAVGLTERCDALVLLVSENGSTSFCIGGILYPFSAT